MIATASAKDHDFLAGLGASEVINYTHEHFEEKVEDVDVVLDTVGGDTQQRSWGVLRCAGILISIVSPVAEKAASLGLRGAFFVVEPNPAQLIQLGQLIVARTGSHGNLVLQVRPRYARARVRACARTGSQSAAN